MKAVILDTETTGGDEPHAVEVAWVDANSKADFSQRYNPGKPILPGAMAVHHITDEDVADEPHHTTFRLPTCVEYVIGHKVDYDIEVVKRCGEMPEVKAICTLALSRRLLPSSDTHTLTGLLYLLDRQFAITHARHAHGAMADVYMTKRLLALLLGEAAKQGIAISSIEDLYALSELARIPSVMTFGKHKGTAIADLPHSYIEWMLKQENVDPYLRKAFVLKYV